MLVKGEIKCLHCGHISGDWVGMKGAALTMAGLRTPNKPADIDPGALVRCLRCDGPVLLDNAELLITGHRLRRIQRLRDQMALEIRRRRAA